MAVAVGAMDSSSQLKADLQSFYRTQAADGACRSVGVAGTPFLLSVHTRLPEQCFIIKLVVNIKISRIFKEKALKHLDILKIFLPHP